MFLNPVFQTPVDAVTPHKNDTLHCSHILKISTRALSKSLWPIMVFECLSSSVIEAGCIVNLAYVPAPLRFERNPGLITRTLSTTCGN
jgi:hypothetical protein